MKLSQFRPGAFLCACAAVATVAGVALAQPPSPKGAPPAAGGGKAPAPAPGPGPGPAPGPGPGGPGAGPGGPGPGGPGGPAAGPSPTFVLRVCNQTKDVKTIFVATASVVGQQFRAQGWTQVPQGQCAATGTFQRAPQIWWHARDPSGIIWGTKPEAELCVNLNGGFEYTWDGQPRQCAQGLTGAPFVKQEIPPNSNQFDVGLN